MQDQLALMVKKLNIGGYHRHLLFCTGGACADAEKSEQIWGFIKARFSELGLTNQKAFRTKVGCLRVCKDGPIALVYPEGTWYRAVDENAAERIIQEHVIGGRPVSDFLFAANPLEEFLDQALT